MRIYLVRWGYDPGNPWDNNVSNVWGVYNSIVKARKQLELLKAKHPEYNVLLSSHKVF